MAMGEELRSWQLLLLLVLLPPVGAYMICLREEIALWKKLAAAVYCAALLIFLLCARPPLGEVVIEAEPWNGIRA